jgi:hypothetical protein
LAPTGSSTLSWQHPPSLIAIRSTNPVSSSIPIAGLHRLPLWLGFADGLLASPAGVKEHAAPPTSQLGQEVDKAISTNSRFLLSVISRDSADQAFLHSTEWCDSQAHHPSSPAPELPLRPLLVFGATDSSQKDWELGRLAQGRLRKTPSAISGLKAFPRR